MQSCAVYAPPVSIDNAIEKGPVKIVAGNHRPVKYRSLVQNNGQVLGITRTANKIRYEQIPGNVRFVRVKDRAASAVLTTVAIIGGGIIIAVPIIAVKNFVESFDMSGFGGNGGWCIDPRDRQPVLNK
jgi:hypothetical protein